MNRNKERKEERRVKRTNGSKGGAIGNGWEESNGIGAGECIGREDDTVRERNADVEQRSSSIDRDEEEEGMDSDEEGMDSNDDGSDDDRSDEEGVGSISNDSSNEGMDSISNDTNNEGMDSRSSTNPNHTNNVNPTTNEVYQTVHATHNALTQAVYTKNVPFLINFTYCDAQSKTDQIAGLQKQCKVDLLLLIYNALKKGIAVELLDLAVLLLRNSKELLYNREYRRIVEDVVEYLKGYSMEYNKVVYLKGKLSYLKRDRKERKRALVERNEDEVV
ncbi:hypothetical protein THOM_3167 [Trachipleistophora hominis]|uniref:Uncharacterized protein n=1 Tax=Trachipleistophora hominis TaxID=72359 RepID=L7JT45_TRAHO|nr:hypothetical protein THOM_3167 [Trachipleistophora hominis]